MQQTYSGSFFAFLIISIFADPQEDLRGGENSPVVFRYEIGGIFTHADRAGWTRKDKNSSLME